MTGCDFLGISMYTGMQHFQTDKKLLQETVINHEVLCNPGEIMTIVDHSHHGFDMFDGLPWIVHGQPSKTMIKSLYGLWLTIID